MKAIIPSTSWNLRCKKDGRVIWESLGHNNLVTEEGCLYTMKTNFLAGEMVSEWYFFLFGNDYQPVFQDSYQAFGANFSEITSISSAQRLSWNLPIDQVAALTLSNATSPSVAVFEEAATIYGAGLISTPSFGNVEGEGVLYAAARFNEPKIVEAFQELEVWMSASCEGIPQ